jgi:hypothetical protein
MTKIFSPMEKWWASFREVKPRQNVDDETYVLEAKAAIEHTTRLIQTWNLAEIDQAMNDRQFQQALGKLHRKAAE